MSCLPSQTGPAGALVNLPIPPEDLRFRVQGATSGDSTQEFLSVGQRCADDIVKALAVAGKKLSEFNAILDFGVGCGRTLRALAPLAPEAEFHGADIDREAIAWCQVNLDFAAFTANAALRPLRPVNKTLLSHRVILSTLSRACCRAPCPPARHSRTTRATCHPEYCTVRAMPASTTRFFHPLILSC